MRKTDVLNIIDEVMNNREIDSIRNAILAIRDKVIEYEDDTDDLTKDYFARLELRGDNELCVFGDYFEGAKFVCINTMAKVDTGIYGGMWYE